MPDDSIDLSQTVNGVGWPAWSRFAGSFWVGGGVRVPRIWVGKRLGLPDILRFRAGGPRRCSGDWENRVEAQVHPVAALPDDDSLHRQTNLNDNLVGLSQ